MRPWILFRLACLLLVPNWLHTTSTNISSWIKWLVGVNARKSNAMKCDVGVLFCAI